MAHGKVTKRPGKSKYNADYELLDNHHHHGSQNKKNSKIPAFWIKIFGSLAVGCVLYMVYLGYLQTRVNTPLKKEKLTELSMINKRENFWGSYRPNLYFGMKTRDPHSLVTGLMWHLPIITHADGTGLRHWCKQEDRLQKYGWTKHDGKTFGVQEIIDRGVFLKTSFVKRPGGQHGGDWTAKIQASLVKKMGHPKVLNNRVSLLYYAAIEEKTNGNIYPIKDQSNKHLIGIGGETQSLGSFKMYFKTNKKETDDVELTYLVTSSPGLHILKEVVMMNMKVIPHKDETKEKLHLVGENLLTPTGDTMKTNFIVTQITADLPLDLEVVFESDSFKDRPERLAGTTYDNALANQEKQFDDKFRKTFGLEDKKYSADEINFAKLAFSNLLGSVGYFYGSSLVKSVNTKGPVPYWPAPLYSAVPSRSFFPRGFLWDEGFHGLLIANWDLDIELDIINHWFDLMNSEGWIPREMILGDEALAKVPEEFVVQTNTNANPPTFFLTLQYILNHKRDEFLPKNLLLLDRLYPRLQAWFEWYNSTQKGLLPSTYRWRGRDPKTNRELNPKTLTSGLDDYPRASHPDDHERHVDLRCWIALAAGVMADIAEILNHPSHHYRNTYNYLTNNDLLNSLHWSNKGQMYADYGFHTDRVKLQWQLQSSRGGKATQEKLRTVLKDPEYKFVDSALGYVSLFPFMLKIVDPESIQLEKILEKLEKPDLLWTNQGLRSLSKNSPIYMKYNTEHDPPYWRGPIWINMNYLTVAALHHYSRTDGPYREKALDLYEKLRLNLVSNIFKEYKKSGYLWENYADDTGQGRGSYPFNGWSSLVVLLMAEKY